MSRWEPNARGRLAKAAFELYFEQGFDQTTVAEIATRAGLAERTFFRYFTDKREVLFWGAADLQVLLVKTVADATTTMSPMAAVGAAIEVAGEFLQENRAGARQRQELIDANTELQERELIKLATLASALAETLRECGVKEPTASLAAESGIAVFRIAFARWVSDENVVDFPTLVRESFVELREVTQQ